MTKVDVISGFLGAGKTTLIKKLLKEALLANKDQPNCDFGKHIIPYLKAKETAMYAYEFNGYWKDVGTLDSYWKANMGLIDLVPEFNLYETYWKIYTKEEANEPLYIAPEGHVERSLVGDGCDISGFVAGSVIGNHVQIGRGSVIRDSIIMSGTVIGDNVTIIKGILGEKCQVGDRTAIGVGDELPNCEKPDIYTNGLTALGMSTVIPADVIIGKNAAISGQTCAADYENGRLSSGGILIRVEEKL